MTSAVSSAASNTAAVAAASGAGSIGSDSLSITQDRFLKLLVAQIQNQDPLNPLQNSEVTSQLAQLSTVTGINKLSDLLSGISSNFAQAQSLQAASVIGHGVLVPGDAINLAQGAALGAVDLPQAVDQLTITIRDAAGATVHTAELGAQASGLVKFQWDGVGDSGSAAPDGSYTYEVKALAAGKPIKDISAFAYGRVDSVSLGAQGSQLNVGGLGSVNISQVKQIL
jgi:flagellar basal-body rod modification protein FlgD